MPRYEALNSRIWISCMLQCQYNTAAVQKTGSPQCVVAKKSWSPNVNFMLLWFHKTPVNLTEHEYE